jgi:hypothetical protein
MRACMGQTGRDGRLGRGADVRRAGVGGQRPGMVPAGGDGAGLAPGRPLATLARQGPHGGCPARWQRMMAGRRRHPSPHGDYSGDWRRRGPGRDSPTGLRQRPGDSKVPGAGAGLCGPAPWGLSAPGRSASCCCKLQEASYNWVLRPMSRVPPRSAWHAAFERACMRALTASPWAPGSIRVA